MISVLRELATLANMGPAVNGTWAVRSDGMGHRPYQTEDTYHGQGR
jgi:hypothetical protein